MCSAVPLNALYPSANKDSMPACVHEDSSRKGLSPEVQSRAGALPALGREADALRRIARPVPHRQTHLVTLQRAVRGQDIAKPFYGQGRNRAKWIRPTSPPCAGLAGCAPIRLPQWRWEVDTLLFLYPPQVDPFPTSPSSYTYRSIPMRLFLCIPLLV